MRLLETLFCVFQILRTGYRSEIQAQREGKYGETREVADLVVGEAGLEPTTPGLEVTT